MLRLLKEKRKGVYGVEWVLLSPLMIMSAMFLLYLLFIGMAYVQYNNLANTFAQDLNMRQSGYRDVGSQEFRYVQIDSGGQRITESGDGSMEDGLRQFVNGFQPAESRVMRITANSNDLRRALNYTARKHQDRLEMPGTVIESANAVATKDGLPVTSFRNRTVSGTSIDTEIRYKIFGMQFKASGYNIIY